MKSLSYKYWISSNYCWYVYDLKGNTKIVKMFFVEGVPFTFDDVESGEEYDPKIIDEARKNRKYSVHELYNYSFYLVDEQAHPCLFDLDLQNPEDMPKDIDYICGEDLSP